MNVSEITSDGMALTWLYEKIYPFITTRDLIDQLDIQLNKLVETFDSIEKEIKRRTVNNHKLNIIIGLYFLIPTGMKFILQLKSMGYNLSNPVDLTNLTNMTTSYEKHKI